MLAYALICTLLLGIMIGVALTVWIAIAIENKSRARVMKSHPSFTERLRAVVQD